jgi:hypothetical protein
LDLAPELGPTDIQVMQHPTVSGAKVSL